MKRIIGSKVYDTEKAELVLNFRRMKKVTTIIGIYERWVDCELYKTKKGAWFEVIGTDTRNPELNVISGDQAKKIIKVDPDKYTELYDDVEEA